MVWSVDNLPYNNLAIFSKETCKEMFMMDKGGGTLTFVKTFHIRNFAETLTKFLIMLELLQFKSKQYYSVFMLPPGIIPSFHCCAGEIMNVKRK